MGKLLELLKLEYEPVAIYRDSNVPSEAVVQQSGFCCMPTLLFSVVKKGKTAAATLSTLLCPGAKSSLGFGPCDDIEGSSHFLSCGIEGGMPGTHKKKTLQLAKDFLYSLKTYGNGDDTIVFSPISKAIADNAPIEVVVFYAAPNHLSALATIVSYAREKPDPATIMPYSSGCQSIYQMPLMEGESDNPRAVLGLTDLVPRVFADSDKFTFAVPYCLYKIMDKNAEESFLSGPEWKKFVEK